MKVKLFVTNSGVELLSSKFEAQQRLPLAKEMSAFIGGAASPYLFNPDGTYRSFGGVYPQLWISGDDGVDQVALCYSLGVIDKGLTFFIRFFSDLEKYTDLVSDSVLDAASFEDFVKDLAVLCPDTDCSTLDATDVLLLKEQAIDAITRSIDLDKLFPSGLTNTERSNLKLEF